MRQAMVSRFTIPLEDRRVLNDRIFELGRKLLEEGHARPGDGWQSDIVPRWAGNSNILGMKSMP